MAGQELTPQNLAALLKEMHEQNAPPEIIAQITKEYTEKMPAPVAGERSGEDYTGHGTSVAGKFAERMGLNSDFWSGVYRSLQPGGSADAAMHMAEKGAIPGAAVGAAKGAVGTVVAPFYLAYKGLENGPQFISDLISKPDEMTETFKNAIANAPANMKATLQGMAEQAQNDPEAFGRSLGQASGELLGGLGAGAGLTKVAQIPEVANGMVRAGTAMKGIRTPIMGRAGMARGLLSGGLAMHGNEGAALAVAAAPSVVRGAGHVVTKLGEMAGGELPEATAALAGPTGLFSDAQKAALATAGHTPEEIAALEKANVAKTVVKQANAPATAAPAAPAPPATAAAPAPAAPAAAPAGGDITQWTRAGELGPKGIRARVGAVKAAYPETGAIPADVLGEKPPTMGLRAPVAAEPAPAAPEAPPARPDPYMDPELATRILGKANEMGDRTMSNFREAGYPVPEKGGITSLADIDKLVASTPEQRAADVLSRQHGGSAPGITSAEGEASVRPGDLTPSQTIEPGAGGPMINRTPVRPSPPASPAEDALNELIQKHGAGLPEVEGVEGEASVRPKDLTPAATVESTAAPTQPKLPKSPYEEALTKIHNGETPTPASDEAAAEVSPAEEALQGAAKPAEEPTMNPEAEAASEPATEQQPEPEEAPEAAPEEPAEEPAKPEVPKNAPRLVKKGKSNRVPTVGTPAPDNAVTARIRVLQKQKPVTPSKSRWGASTHVGMSPEDEGVANSAVIEDQNISADDLNKTIENARAARKASYKGAAK